eukprot:scaffold21007_cov52-Attheya_sp.AAC.1
MTSHDIQNAARITVVFSTLYMLTLVNQILTKKRLFQQFKAQGKTFNRYAAPEMLNADRLVANLLEWSLVFLSPLWSLAATGHLSEAATKIAWTYVGVRGFYCILVTTFGVTQNGYNLPLWAATLPGYFCLLYLAAQAFVLLF